MSEKKNLKTMIYDEQGKEVGERFIKEIVACTKAKINPTTPSCFRYAIYASAKSQKYETPDRIIESPSRITAVQAKELPNNVAFIVSV